MNWKWSRLTTAQVMMRIEHRRTNESGKGGLLDSGDVQIRENVEFEREELRQPPSRLGSARVHAEQSVALETKSSDKTVERIFEPLTVALRQRAAGRTASLSEALPQLPTSPMRRSARIAIKAKGKILFIDAGDVIAVEAKGNYVLLVHTSGSHMLRESISTMEEKLDLHGFVRIHRSVLVNAALVEEIQPWSTGEYVLRVRGGREYTVTRTYKKNLQLLAQSWIGTEGFDAE